MPAASVELNVGDAPGPYGVFGSCTTLTLIFDRAIKGKRVHAQDLAADQALDITNHIHIDDRSLQLCKSDLQRFGLHNVSEGDVSSPGLVISLSS
jgi:hypothetical protein